MICAVALTVLMASPFQSAVIHSAWDEATRVAPACMKPVTVNVVKSIMTVTPNGPTTHHPSMWWKTSDGVGAVAIDDDRVWRVFLLHEFGHHLAWSCGIEQSEYFPSQFAWRRLQGPARPTCRL